VFFPVPGSCRASDSISKLKLYLAITLALLLGTSAGGRAASPPQIIGVAHISLLAHDFEASRSFYRDMLGFEEPYSLKNAHGSPSMTFFKVNDRHYIELAPEKTAGGSRLNHFALEVPDAEAMRKYLEGRGVTVPDHVPTGRIGNLNFMIKDPQGVSVEIVQYGPASWTVQAKGKFMSGRRISSRIMHVGFVVTDLKAELDFYTGVLGFREFWRGSKDGQVLSWINLKLPDSDDYIELMLYGKTPAPNTLGGANHLCLEVPSADSALVLLKQRAAATDYKRPLEIHTGKNGKRQINLYDPDGTRTELMESHTANGQPAPSSAAPPPVRMN
jgi:catechol 2,3-dioxygenase-like lactoylglutathione lyase family enzyme